jgi:hypothetical protein
MKAGLITAGTTEEDPFVIGWAAVGTAVCHWREPGRTRHGVLSGRNSPLLREEEDAEDEKENSRSLLLTVVVVCPHGGHSCLFFCSVLYE